MTEQATFAGGCFWCIEAAFKEVDGVTDVVAGYAGGHVEDPTYEEVCGGETGHAEAVQVTYDPETVTYGELLAIFFRIHDPTTADRQGPDVGSQYRPVIFYHDDEQRTAAERVIERLENEGTYDAPIVTAVEPLDTFYPADERHQNYFEKHPDDAYCVAHAAPKVETVREMRD
jgi:peptide-methionine (S)-S-oxide reductase